MAEQVGLARYFNLEWLDAAADCKIADNTKEEARIYLDDLIGQRIQSKDNIRKTRTIMLNVWYGNDAWFVEECTKICRGIFRKERLGLHWALIMIYYPVFFDLCTVIGSSLEYKDEIQFTQIKARIFEKWGARNTLEHSLSKNFQTLKDMNVLEPGEKVGSYKPVCHVLNDPKIVCVLAAAILKSSGRDYMTWEQIIRHPALFPFKLRGVTQADMPTCGRLALERIGDDIVIRLKA